MGREVTVTHGVFTFCATTIGAGILALPVAASRSGFFPLVLLLLFLGTISLLSALYIAEATLCSGKEKHLPGLARVYLGRWGLAAMIAGTMVFIYGALSSYLMAGGQIYHDLSNGAIPAWLGTLIHCVAGSLIIYSGMLAASRVEAYLFYVMLMLLGILVVMLFPRIDVQLVARSGWLAAPEVFGVTVFAFVGHSVLPSIAAALQRKRSIIKVATGGIVIPCILYAIWSFVVLGVVPASSSSPSSLEGARAAGQPATVPLGLLVGGSVMLLGTVFAAVATLTSYAGFGLSLSDEYADIASMTPKKRLAGSVRLALVSAPPVLIALLNPTGFVDMLDIAGAVGGATFVGILPALMVLRIRKSQLRCDFRTWGGKFVPVVVLTTYVAGMLYTLFRQVVSRIPS
jgi:amino acid permease